MKNEEICKPQCTFHALFVPVGANAKKGMVIL